MEVIIKAFAIRNDRGEIELIYLQRDRAEQEALLINGGVKVSRMNCYFWINDPKDLMLLKKLGLSFD